jgi:hypothetical protein
MATHLSELNEPARRFEDGRDRFGLMLLLDEAAFAEKKLTLIPRF